MTPPKQPQDIAHRGLPRKDSPRPGVALCAAASSQASSRVRYTLRCPQQTFRGLLTVMSHRFSRVRFSTPQCGNNPLIPAGGGG